MDVSQVKRARNNENEIKYLRYGGVAPGPIYANEIVQLSVAVEAGAGRDEANPAGTRVHNDEERS